MKPYAQLAQRIARWSKAVAVAPQLAARGERRFSKPEVSEGNGSELGFLFPALAALLLLAACATTTPPHAYEGRFDFVDGSEAEGSWMCVARGAEKVECSSAKTFVRNACTCGTNVPMPKPTEL